MAAIAINAIVSMRTQMMDTRLIILILVILVILVGVASGTSKVMPLAHHAVMTVHDQ